MHQHHIHHILVTCVSIMAAYRFSSKHLTRTAWCWLWALCVGITGRCCCLCIDESCRCR